MYENWFEDNLLLKKELKEQEICFSNMCTATFKIKGLPVIVLTNNKQIKKGEMLSFDYGSSYWIYREIVPSLFYKNGQMIEKSFYRLNSFFIYLCFTPQIVSLLPNFDDEKKGKEKKYYNNNFPFLYNQDSFKKNYDFFCFENSFYSPIYFSFFNLPSSFFFIRKQLVINGVLDTNYAPLEEIEIEKKISLLKNQKSLFSEFFQLEFYLRNPLIQRNSPSQYVDLLIFFSEDQSHLFSHFVSILENEKKWSKNILHFDNTMEIIFLNVFDESFEHYLVEFFENFLNLEKKEIKKKSFVKENKIFTRENQLIQMEEYILQHEFILENLLEEDFEIEKLKETSHISTKELKLNLLTRKYFHPETTKIWKRYPRKYINENYKDQYLLNMTLEKISFEKSEKFVEYLKEKGFESSKLLSSKNKKLPSIIVVLK